MFVCVCVSREQIYAILIMQCHTLVSIYVIHATDWTTKQYWFDSLQCAKDFLFSTRSRLALEPQ